MEKLHFNTPVSILMDGQESPLLKRIKAHADKRLPLDKLADPSQRLTIAREYLRLEMELLRRYHKRESSGLMTTHAYACVLDELLIRLYRVALDKLGERSAENEGHRIALVALGGYGRGELSPLSDIDIMFLCPARMSKKRLQPIQEVMTGEILYPLWDLKLKVGHSTRTTREAIDEAKNNVESKSALLEVRRICGSQKLFDRFLKQYREFYRRDNPEGFARLRLHEQVKRREQYGNTVYLQQPNIKNGVGGLRDYQNILWVAYARLNTRSINELIERGYLNAGDAKRLVEAYDFLLWVRNELHFQSTKPNDVLSLERQPEIAWELNYHQEDIFQRVEAFMQDYFRHASAIYQISRLLERRLAAGTMPDEQPVSMRSVIHARQSGRRERFDGLLLEGGRISYQNKFIFQEEPERLIRVFRHAQQMGLELDLELLVLIRDNLPLIDATLIQSESANKSFRALLQSIGDVSPTLYLMHECGVLGRFIPEFGKLDCLVQHEYYHLYTADIHTLRAIEELDRVFQGANEQALKYREAIRAVPLPPLLYLMLLLHDLGKAEGIKGHAEASISISKPLLQRMGVPVDYHEQILFIIDKHFEMARQTIYYDVDDSRVTQAFANAIGNAENLRFLYVHSYCDARATSKDLWNAYKDALHTSLYQNTLLQFEDAERVEATRAHRVQKIQEKVRAMAGNEVPEEEIQAHFSLLPEHYFLNTKSEDIILHIQMIHVLFAKINSGDEKQMLDPVIRWQDDREQGLTNVHVITWDRAGLFYKLAGALTLAELSILTSKIITRKDSISIDTFCLVDALGGMVRSESARNTFEQSMQSVLKHNEDLSKAIEELIQQKHSRIVRKETERLHTDIPPRVEIHEDSKVSEIIVEIEGTDHVGLLYQLSRVINEAGFDVRFARISTHKDAALDVFHVQPNKLDKSQPEEIATPKEHLLESLKDDLLAVLKEQKTIPAS